MLLDIPGILLRNLQLLLQYLVLLLQLFDDVLPSDAASTAASLGGAVAAEAAGAGSIFVFFEGCAAVVFV